MSDLFVFLDIELNDRMVIAHENQVVATVCQLSELDPSYSRLLARLG